MWDCAISRLKTTILMASCGDDEWSKEQIQMYRSRGSVRILTQIALLDSYHMSNVLELSI